MLGTWNFSRLLEMVLPVLLVIVSVTLHEVAHGYVAYRCGDPTAKEAGRLTLNPLAHLDPVGSVLLPILMAVASGGSMVFSFAKPVPVNLSRLKNPDRDNVLVALAGPAANFLQAIVGALICRWWFATSVTFGATADYWISAVLVSYVSVNLSLMCFNLIPLPPLDGSKLVWPLLPQNAKMAYIKFQPYAIAVLMLLLYVAPRVLGFDPIGMYYNVTARPLFSLLLGL